MGLNLDLGLDNIFICPKIVIVLIKMILKQMLKEHSLFYLNLFLAFFATISFLFLLKDIIRIKWQNSFVLTEPHFTNPNYNQLKLTDYNLIFKNNPFGFQVGELKPFKSIKSIGTKEKNEIIRSFTLLGTVISQNFPSFAIIKNNKTQEQDIFKIGDSVFNAGILKKVFKNKIFIEIDDKEIEICLHDKDLKNIQEIQLINSDFIKKRGNIYILNSKKVEYFLKNPAKIVSGGIFVPYIINGKQNGWILKGIKSDSIYTMLGLKNGDVLVAVNGYPLSNPEAALQTFTAIQQGIERLEIDIIRNGEKKRFIYQIM